MTDLWVTSISFVVFGVFGMLFLVGFQDYNSLEHQTDIGSFDDNNPDDQVQIDPQDDSNTLETPDIDSGSTLEPLPFDPDDQLPIIEDLDKPLSFDDTDDQEDGEDDEFSSGAGTANIEENGST